MATFASGVKGWVEIPTGAGLGAVQTHFRNWSGSVERDIVNANTFEDILNAEKSMGLLHDFKATTELITDDAATPILSHMQTVDATPIADFVFAGIKGGANHKGYKFAGFITRMNIRASVLEEQRITVDVESSGDITTDPAV